MRVSILDIRIHIDLLSDEEKNEIIYIFHIFY